MAVFGHRLLKSTTGAVVWFLFAFHQVVYGSPLERLLEATPGGMTAGADRLYGMMSKMDSLQEGRSQKTQPASEINLLEVGTVPPVPVGTFSGVPLPLAFYDAASLLPIKKTRIRSEPLAADSARSLFV
jgi:hypothetical protein